MKATRIVLIMIGALICLARIGFASDKGAVDSKLLKQYEKQSQEQCNDAMINAITNNNIKSLSLNRDLLTRHNDMFNVKVKQTDVINQRSTGRCWMFAGINSIAPKVMTKLELSDFEISEAYLAFYDKIEKSNMFLETIIDMRDRPLDDRSLSGYIQSPIGDGGWWHYFTGLIEKYGVVPSSAMPETKQSSATGRLNSLLKSLLRKDAAELRSMNTDGKSEKQLRTRKEEMLGDVYALLTATYGRPPQEFVFRYEQEIDSVKTLVEKTYTPASFFAEHFGDEMPEYVAIVNNPAMDYDQLFELEHSRNIQENADLNVLNLPIETLKQYTMKALLDSQIVWFACDVGKDNYGDSGIFAVDIYDYNATFGIDFKLPKADRIRYWDMSPNHAMAITGADTTTEGITRKWLVENSWGTKKGDDGHWTMYDNWFDEWVLMVIVDKRLLTDEDARKFDAKPVKIADWQPFFKAMRELK